MQAAEELGEDEEKDLGMARIPQTMITPTSIAAALRPDLTPQVGSQPCTLLGDRGLRNLGGWDSFARPAPRNNPHHVHEDVCAGHSCRSQADCG